MGHGSHEHGKDIIAIDPKGKVHAYQLKDGDLDLGKFEKGYAQLVALVETQVEHPAINGQPRHQPWLVISGHTTMPVEDRIRVHNLEWRRRRFAPLKLITGRELLGMFLKMSGNFWPQKPADTRSFLSLYLADGKGALDRSAFAGLIAGITSLKEKITQSEAARRISAANLFASYALSSFHVEKNYWELIQGWIMTAARIAWVADKAKLPAQMWKPSFRLAVDESVRSLEALCEETLQANALDPNGFELDELARSRCTICAGLLSAQILILRKSGQEWGRQALAKETLERLFTEGRHFLWGESAVPFFLLEMWALDQLRADQFSDRILFSVLATVAIFCSRGNAPKLCSPYDSADEACSKLFLRVFKGDKDMELRSAASFTLEPLVTITARRMWRGVLARYWSYITRIDLIQLVAEKSRDLLLWHWGDRYGKNQARRYPAPQSWRELLKESRSDENEALPSVLKEEFDFSVLFMVCFPHRLTRPFVKYMEEATSQL